MKRQSENASAAGDWNNDGFEDLALGCSECTTAATSQRQLMIFDGELVAGGLNLAGDTAEALSRYAAGVGTPRLPVRCMLDFGGWFSEDIELPTNFLYMFPSKPGRLSVWVSSNLKSFELHKRARSPRREKSEGMGRKGER
jgi:hypothetical protein